MDRVVDPTCVSHYGHETLTVRLNNRVKPMLSTKQNAYGRHKIK